MCGLDVKGVDSIPALGLYSEGSCAAISSTQYKSTVAEVERELHACNISPDLVADIITRIQNDAVMVKASVCPMASFVCMAWLQRMSQTSSSLIIPCRRLLAKAPLGRQNPRRPSNNAQASEIKGKRFGHGCMNARSSVSFARQD